MQCGARSGCGRSSADSQSPGGGLGRARQDAKAEELDALNLRLGAELLADGRVYVGTTRYCGVVAFRPAIVNWRTTESDVELIVDVVREIGARLGVMADR